MNSIPTAHISNGLGTVLLELKSYDFPLLLSLLSLLSLLLNGYLKLLRKP